MDLERGRLFYSNAGHNFPLLRRTDGTLVELGNGGLPLGILENSQYEVGEQPFSAGDALLLYSDGISEALDERRDEFGEDRLRAFWRGREVVRPASTIAALIREVEAFRGRALQSDDMTAVVVGEHGDA